MGAPKVSLTCYYCGTEFEAKYLATDSHRYCQMVCRQMVLYHENEGTWDEEAGMSFGQRDALLVLQEMGTWVTPKDHGFRAIAGTGKYRYAEFENLVSRGLAKKSKAGRFMAIEPEPKPNFDCGTKGHTHSTKQSAIDCQKAMAPRKEKSAALDQRRKERQERKNQILRAVLVDEKGVREIAREKGVQASQVSRMIAKAFKDAGEEGSIGLASFAQKKRVWSAILNGKRPRKRVKLT